MSAKEGMAYATDTATESRPRTEGGGSAGRRQFSLGQDSLKRLAALRESTDAASSSEVIRNALRVYDYLVREEEQGHKLLIEQEADKYIQLKIL